MYSSSSEKHVMNVYTTIEALRAGFVMHEDLQVQLAVLPPSTLSTSLNQGAAPPLRRCKNIEYIVAILRGAINTKYIDNT